MGHILDLPTELLPIIYLHLNNIDDALHLARCCKRFNGVFEYHRLAILRNIIQNADHHVYDARLCEEIGLHEHYTLHMSQTRFVSFDPTLRRTVMNAYRASLQPSPVLPANVVWDTLVRWQAMRLLFDLYCDASVHETYSQSAFRFDQGQDDELVDTYRPFPPPSGAVCPGFAILDHHHRQRAYERFYKALTAHWWLVERRWAIRVDVYETPEECVEAFLTLRPTMRQFVNPAHTIQEWMDLLELDDFVWNFLARRALDLTDRAAWLLATWSRIFNPVDRYRQDELAQAWGRVLPRILGYLRPSNIIELLLRSQWASRGDWRLNRETYLRHIGDLDAPFGVYANGDLDFTEAMPQLRFLEGAVDEALVHLSRGIGPDTREVCTYTRLTVVEQQLWFLWTTYRFDAWPEHVRGQLFFWDDRDSRQMVQRIQGAVPLPPEA
ncbi:uncharacterized protein BO80DRAFT_486755 [Aspergillus ibericus CBS 121593]|uniref:F-box domain-containing protein n=1 Tax=Aspergillus ibericus CBS 121593 TaxID=1448316 RepID=A0A395GJN2_9EURO|nr:hypothetical protein BO80DRAFT_486755 [Aspergillus ibericus CBS 121593]RAK95574.1 hypothetical protein BO80DRAFT_486755 [Aspergillus ibericus CBS 121593]